MSSSTHPVIVTTKHRGVFFGYADDGAASTDDRILLSGAKMAIYFGTDRGLFQLAHTGPTTKSRISAPADIDITDITAVIDVTPEAEAAWIKA